MLPSTTASNPGEQHCCFTWAGVSSAPPHRQSTLPPAPGQTFLGMDSASMHAQSPQANGRDLTALAQFLTEKLNVPFEASSSGLAEVEALAKEGKVHVVKHHDDRDYMILFTPFDKNHTSTYAQQPEGNTEFVASIAKVFSEELSEPFEAPPSELPRALAVLAMKGEALIVKHRNQNVYLISFTRDEGQSDFLEMPSPRQKRPLAGPGDQGSTTFKRSRTA